MKPAPDKKPSRPVGKHEGEAAEYVKKMKEKGKIGPDDRIDYRGPAPSGKTQASSSWTARVMSSSEDEKGKFGPAVQSAAYELSDADLRDRLASIHESHGLDKHGTGTRVDGGRRTNSRLELLTPEGNDASSHVANIGSGVSPSRYVRAYTSGGDLSPWTGGAKPDRANDSRRVVDHR